MNPEIMHPNIIIDSEFQALLDPLEAVERAQLEKNIVADGCRDPLVLWLKPAPQPGDHKCYAYDESKCDLRLGDGVWTCEHCEHNPALLEYVLVDGHNRYEICTRLGIDFDTVEVEFDDRDAAMDWIDANQMGKRNMSPEAFTRAMGRRYNRAKKSQHDGGAGQTRSGGQIEPHLKTADRLATEHGVSPATVKRAGAYDTAAKVIEAAGGSVSGENQQDVVQAARVVADVPALADDVPLAAQFAKLPQEVQQAALAAVAESSEPAKEVMREAVHNHRAQGTGENEWYTPQEYITAAYAVLGGVDLDPASSPLANKTVQAARIFTIEDDGLTQEWAGRVWMNPPYAQPFIAQFVDKLCSEHEAGRVTEAIALTHNYTDTQWFHRAAKACSAICFTRGRIGFVNPEGKRAAPTQGQAFFYYGANVSAFLSAFASIGFVVEVQHV